MEARHFSGKMHWDGVFPQNRPRSTNPTLGYVTLSLKRPMPKQSVSLEGLTSQALPLITSEPKPRSLSQSIHPCPELLGSFLYFILHPQDLLTWSSTTAQKTLLLQPKTTQTWGTISTSRVRSPAMPETAFRNSMRLSRLGHLNPAQSPSAYIPVCAEPCRL